MPTNTSRCSWLNGCVSMVVVFDVPFAPQHKILRRPCRRTYSYRHTRRGTTAPTASSFHDCAEDVAVPALLAVLPGNIVHHFAQERSEGRNASQVIRGKFPRALRLHGSASHDLHLRWVQLQNHPAVLRIPFDIRIRDIGIEEVSRVDMLAVDRGVLAPSAFPCGLTETRLFPEELMVSHAPLCDRVRPWAEREAGGDVAGRSALHARKRFHVCPFLFEIFVLRLGIPEPDHLPANVLVEIARKVEDRL